MSIKRFLCLFFSIALLFSAVLAEEAEGTRLLALNVGKADCLLLMSGGFTYLIDTGYEHTFNTLLDALRRYQVDHLDGVFLTHCDKDHAGGLSLLAESDIGVSAWYASDCYYDLPFNGHPMIAAAALRNASVTWLSAGDVLNDGFNTFTLLGPLSVSTENENNNSMVFLFESPDGSILFTGDMKAEEENELLRAGVFSQVDIVKVPFHGDNSASSRPFTEAVHAALAIISTSTSEEADTPSSAVIKRYGLMDTPCVVTQEYDFGVLVTLLNGQLASEAVQRESAAYKLRASIDLENDTLKLLNFNSEPVSLSGWLLYSSEGETTIVLPKEAVIPANGVLRIGTRMTGSGADIYLDCKRLWHKSKRDTAVLYDLSGAVAVTVGNGL